MTSYKMNTEKNGIEIYFNEKPDEATRNLMKANGFRWGRVNMCWYAKQSEKTIALAKNLTGDTQNNSPEVDAATSYPFINIEDVSSYTIDQELQDREHDSAWIFRKNKRNHNIEMQDLFKKWNEASIEIIQQTENEYYIYKIKETLQRYKKRYHETFIKYLTHKANNPSWAVTGRGGMNVSRYNKKMDRQHSIMMELANFPQEFEDRLYYYQNKIRKEKVQAIQVKAAATEIDLVFKTETKEITYMNIEDRRRVYIYENYWISKLWGCYRIFKNGTEIHSMKTTDRLDSAKKYVCMLVNDSKNKQVVS